MRKETSCWSFCSTGAVDLWKRRLLIYHHCRRILRGDCGRKNLHIFRMNFRLFEIFFYILEVMSLNLNLMPKDMFCLVFSEECLQKISECIEKKN